MADHQKQNHQDKKNGVPTKSPRSGGRSHSPIRDELRELFRGSTIFVLSFTGMVGCGYILVSGRWLPTGTSLYVVYSTYVVSSLFLLHSMFFKLNSFLEERQNAHRRRIPRYLEYAYSLLISVGLVQIAFANSKAFDYLTFVMGDEKHFSQLIVEEARDEFAKNCGRKEFKRHSPIRRSEFFVPGYCRKLQTISERGTDAEYFVNELSKDTDFLNQPIGFNDSFWEILLGGSLAKLYKNSPIRDYVESLVTLKTYRQSYAESNSSSNIYWWIGLLLFPIGVSLRVVKTSLELFGRLDTK